MLLTQFAYNSSEYSTIKISLFEANYSYKLEAYLESNRLSIENQSARIKVEDLKTLYVEIKAELDFVIRKSIEYYNKKYY